MEVVYIAIGLVLGGAITFLLAKQKFSHRTNDSKETEVLKQEIQRLNILAETEKGKLDHTENDLHDSKQSIETKELELRSLGADLAAASVKLQEAVKTVTENKENLKNALNINEILAEECSLLKTEKAEQKVAKEGVAKELQTALKASDKLKEQLEEKTTDFNEANKTLATQQANNKALQEKLDTQKKEIEDLGKKFNTEFQNIANKILEEKTEKFTNVNKTSLEGILKPLGENIDKFKKQIEDVYDKEAKERFSLGEQVKEMAKLNKIISDEAKNLTTALKGEAKTQGNWGEMILESILEKSGLRKNEEYFMEHQLLDDDGKPLRSDSENKKMRPDAVIKYPDNRNVIIDSKVSLNAFTRYIAASEKDIQDMELQAHISALKNHIISLSNKGYDDYNKALDFVMMFVPSEPAYIAAMQGDPDLWNFAYNKRILLMNPTNLITSLKLIVDLWKREYQNQNAIAIAERGAKLYDKFVSFVTNLEGIGTNLEKAQKKYEEAHKQLNTGNDNLVLQATKLKDLGVKNKKELDKGLVDQARLTIDL
ncbi:MAG: DNA recombination protein RmuC [Bacteroidales bacterium]|nr:DNA recombination protein RmuC [Bacteroidales bacterium]